MIKVALCDDDKNVVSHLENLLNQYKERDFEYDIFFSGEDLIFYMEKNKLAYDIYILDIEMGKVSGQEIAQSIRGANSRALIVFITAHIELMEAAFDVQAFHFLKKPLDDKKFMHVFKAAFTYLVDTKKVLTIKQRKKELDIFCDEIIFFESEKRKMIAYTINGYYKFYMSIHEVLSHLDPRFFIQVHGSYIVNLQYIKSYVSESLLFEREYKVPISRKYSKNFKEKYRDYVKMRI